MTNRIEELEELIYKHEFVDEMPNDIDYDFFDSIDYDHGYDLDIPVCGKFCPECGMPEEMDKCLKAVEVRLAYAQRDLDEEIVINEGDQDVDSYTADDLLKTVESLNTCMTAYLSQIIHHKNHCPWGVAANNHRQRNLKEE